MNREALGRFMGSFTQSLQFNIVELTIHWICSAMDGFTGKLSRTKGDYNSMELWVSYKLDFARARARAIQSGRMVSFGKSSYLVLRF